MRNFLIVILAFVAFSSTAQKLESLPRSVQRQYEKDVKRAEKESERLIEDGWDIVPSPIEVPIVIPATRDAGALQNVSWQSNLQRVTALRQRIQNECKFPVHFKISDSGVDQTHPDLKKGFTGEKDWTGEGFLAGQHGTHVTGIVLQLVQPLIDAGIATYDDQKNLTAAGSGSFAWGANMFNAELADTKKRVDAGQSVVWNCSWGGGTAVVGAVETAMQKQVEAGAIIVAAAGNSGGAVGYPGLSPWVFGISSLDENMIISSFSSRGVEVDATAGGRNIMSTLPGAQYGIMSGTSMASPAWAAFVGYARAKWGIAALPNYDALRSYMKKISIQVGNGDPNLYGFGYAYIEAILNTKPDTGGGTPPPPPPPPPVEPGNFYTTGVTSNYQLLWRRERETAWRVLHLEQIKWEALGDVSESDVYADIDAMIRDYFGRSGLVLTDAMGEYSATWWAGQFLEYHAGNSGKNMDVLEVDAIGAGGQRYFAVSFDKAATDFLSLMQGVRIEALD